MNLVTRRWRAKCSPATTGSRPRSAASPGSRKPALYYWQTMLAYRVFGVSDWAARLPSAVDATLMVVAIYLFLRRFRPGFQLDGALMAASAAGVIGFARAASMDMPLAAMFTIAMLAWYAWYESHAALPGTVLLFLGPACWPKDRWRLLAAVIVVIFATAKGDYRLVRRTPGFPASCCSSSRASLVHRGPVEESGVFSCIHS